MKRTHDMPFGAQLLPRVAARFPSVGAGRGRVELLRPGAGRRAGRTDAMPALGGGWFELRARSAPPGLRYAFRIDGGWSCPTRPRAATPTTCTAPASWSTRAFDWPDAGWRGRPWHEAVIYELHVGCFTPARAASARPSSAWTSWWRSASRPSS
jgi:maltooligosyltrehalose trehalohydrolase